MTGSHSRLVAVQAVVVALLLVLVFATLLQPESEDPIQAVQGPAGGQGPVGTTTLPGPDVYNANPGTGGATPPPGGGGGEGGGPTAPGETGGAGGTATTTIPLGPGAPQGTDGLGITGPDGGAEDETRPGGEGDSPEDDQYQSALLQLALGGE